MNSTTNYSLPTYEGTDSPNLITGYNAAMATVDTQMKANADAASAADTKATNAASAASAADTKATNAASAASAADTKATNAASAAATADGKAVAAQNTANANATAITALDGRVDALEESSFVPSSTDPSFNVSNLSGAKVTSNGIVYIPQS